MSRRTSEASKAIATAWQNEQQLVLEGKGTRDWTPEQQRDILDKGKAYDATGKAFEGHHMKSAEKFPEYQGDAENIQFLSRQEHFAAHNGNYQIPTNGYFNPHTGETIDFGFDKYKACEIIQLTNPVIQLECENIVDTVEAKCKESDFETIGDSKRVRKVSVETNSGTKSMSEFSKSKPSKISNFVGYVEKVGKFLFENKEMIIGGALAIGTVIGVIKSGNKTLTNIGVDDKSNSFSTEDNISSVSGEDVFEDSEKKSHASPCEHIVPAHKQRYNGEWREKAPYPRGKGKKTGDNEK